MKIDRLKSDIRAISKYTLVLFVILVYWELLLYYNLHSSISEVTIWNILFMFPIAVTFTCLLGFNKHVNSILLILIVFLISIFYEANFIYFKTFGSLFSISMVGAGGDAITNFWWSIITTIKENIIMVALFELPIILLIIEAIVLKKLKDNYRLFIHPVVLALGIGLWFLIVLALPLQGKQDYTAYGAYHSRFVDTDTASKKLGILPNTLIETRYAIIGSGREQLIDVEEIKEIIESKPHVEYHKYESLSFDELEDKTDNENIKNVCAYLNTVAPNEYNDKTGMFKGYNLIYICGESFSSMAIDPNITPTLYKLSTNGFVLENYYNAFKNVTTNGEYALLTGLWPDVAREETNMGRLTGTMGQSVDKNMSQALGNKFNELGITSRAYHNYYGYYYGRNETLPNMGFTCKFMDEGMNFTSTWPASDLEMMKQSIDDYINDNQFCSYYMTFSGHGNYSETNVMVQRNIEYVRSKTEGKELPENVLGYYACNVELDKALEYLIQRLKDVNKLNKTVIVLTGDHYPYYLTYDDCKAINGSYFRNDFDNYHSTCIIYNSAMQKEFINTPCCNVDILPTILNLFGIDYDSRLYAGTDIFSNGKHVAMLYNKSFITDEVKYDATNGKTIWLNNVSNKSQEDLDEHINKYNSYVKNKYAFSIAVENYDFYDFVFKNYVKHMEIKPIQEIEENTDIEENIDINIE